jgi:hypothetical protein
MLYLPHLDTTVCRKILEIWIIIKIPQKNLNYLGLTQVSIFNKGMAPSEVISMKYS